MINPYAAALRLTMTDKVAVVFVVEGLANIVAVIAWLVTKMSVAKILCIN